MVRPILALTLAFLATPVLAGEIGNPDPTVDKAPTMTTYTVAGLGAMHYPGASYTPVQTALWGYHALDWKDAISPAFVTHNPPAYINPVRDVPDAGNPGVACQHATDLDYLEANSDLFTPFLYEMPDPGNPATLPYVPGGQWVCPESPSPVETVAMALLAIDRWGSPTYFDYIIPTASGSTDVAMIETIDISTPPNLPTLTQACHVQSGNINQLIDDFLACAWTVPWTVDSMTVRLWTKQAVGGQFTWTQTMTPGDFIAGYLHTQNELTMQGKSITLQHVLDPDDEEVAADQIVSLAAALSGALHAEAFDGSIVPLIELPPAEVPEVVVVEGPGR